jgi:hypothetical protein
VAERGGMMIGVRLARLVMSLLSPLVLCACPIEDDPSMMADEDPTGPSSPPMCVELCDPLASDCESGSSCLPDGPGFSCMAVSSSTDGVHFGLHQPCEVTAQQCDSGLLCLQVMVPGCSGASGCCVAFCDRAQPQCSAGTECISYFGEDAPCFPEVGVCVPG